MNENDVKLPEAPVVEPIEPKPEAPVEPKPGEKTDSTLLLKSLQEERDKRRDLEKELQALKDASGNTGEALSEEGQLLKKQIDDLGAKLAATENEKRLGALEAAHPALKDKATEFETYRANPDHKGMSLETAAKAFLADNGLLGPIPPPRKGLEEDKGGGHAPTKQGKTPEEIDELRQTNYREYSRQIKSGEINL